MEIKIESNIVIPEVDKKSREYYEQVLGIEYKKWLNAMQIHEDNSTASDFFNFIIDAVIKK